MDVQSKKGFRRELLADFGLILFVVTNGLFAHGKWGQLGLLLFAASVVPVVLRRKGLVFDRWFIGYGLLIVWGAVGTLLGWAVNRPQAMAMVKTLVIDFVFLFVLLQYLTARKELTAPINAYMIAVFIIILGIFRFSGGHIRHYRFGQAAGINPNTVAGITIIAYVGSLYLAFRRKKPAYLLCTALFLLTILVTGSRKGLLTVAVFTPVYVLWMDRKHLVRDLAILMVIAAVSCWFLFGIEIVRNNIGERLLESIKSVLGLAEKTEQSIAERGLFSKMGMEIFLKAPLKGCGLDCFRFASGTETYAHNNYIELLADGGIVALLLYYVPILGIGIRCLKRSKDDAAVFGAVLILMFFAQDIATVSYYERTPLMILMLAASVLHRNGEGFFSLGKFSAYLRNPSKGFVILAMRGRFDDMDDETYLRKMYRGMMGKKPDFSTPKTFSEKINVLKLTDRKPEYTVMCDKYAARGFIAEKVGDRYLVPLLGVWDSADAVGFEELPESFVLKTTHDSGGVRIVTEKSKADTGELRAFFKKRLAKKYHLMWRERQYEGITPRIIAEAYLGKPDGTLPRDYKLWCFNGKVRLLQIYTDRATDKKVWYFGTDGKPLPCTAETKAALAAGGFPVGVPSFTEQMIPLAEKLAEGVPFLRVDFYCENGKIFVGEMTFAEDAGFCTALLPEWDEKLGGWLTLPAVGK
ncbi:MAG: ATP-grasp fold amidoligase family protein [Clostridia bacterium]|nr:ATP-grasp fold amidoligase family protein [Clostridia bacterium]